MKNAKNNLIFKNQLPLKQVTPTITAPIKKLIDKHIIFLTLLGE